MFRELRAAGALSPQIVLAVSKQRRCRNYKSIADLKGKKIGVTRAGVEHQSIMAQLRAREGRAQAASDVSFIGVGAGAGAIAALAVGADRRDLQPRSGDDHARTIGRHPHRRRHAHAAERRSVFGGPTCRRLRCTRRTSFIKKNPEHRAGADQRDGARADVAADGDGPGTDRRPCRPEYLLGDRALYLGELQQGEGRVLAGWPVHARTAPRTRSSTWRRSIPRSSQRDQPLADLRQQLRRRRRWRSTRSNKA